MRPPLALRLAPERLDEGDPEERACFGMLTICANETELTGGMDYFISSYRPGPLVSGYHFAEWLASNWWRLCYEPKTTTPDWWRSHKMTAIGEGYTWPNITMMSDGLNTTILSEPSVRPDAKPFRYIGAAPCVLATIDFQAALDAFVATVQGRLREQGVGETSLDRVWRDVNAERRNPDLERRRHLEALLGRDAGGVEDELIDRLIDETAAVGDVAVQELAAHGGQGAPVPSLPDLRQSADANGYPARPQDAIRLDLGEDAKPQSMRAWRLGTEAAHALRKQAGLGGDPISDDRLSELAGVASDCVRGAGTGHDLSFAIDLTAKEGKVVLRSKWKTGRRFELARLLADRVVAPTTGRLHVATKAATYRQKMQRSFAAELLSPFTGVEAMLDGDYSAEAQLGVAEHFAVSERTILTLLVNHGRLERDEIEGDIGATA